MSDHYISSWFQKRPIQSCIDELVEEHILGKSPEGIHITDRAAVQSACVCVCLYRYENVVHSQRPAQNPKH